MNRREFIAGLGGAAVWPLVARGQQQPVPVIGVLNAGGPISADPAFRRGLNELGFVEGRNVAFEYLWADGQYDRLPALAAELVRRKVAAIYATGTANSAMAAKAATATIPIVFQNGSDPIKVGLVTSMNRPDGNATGVTGFQSTLAPKRLGMLRELVPQAKLIAFLTNPANPISDPADIQAAADDCLDRQHRGRDRQGFRGSGSAGRRCTPGRWRFALQRQARSIQSPGYS